MKRFKCVVTQEKEYIVELDEKPSIRNDVLPNYKSLSENFETLIG